MLTALTKFVLGIAILGGILFLCGGFGYWNAWVFLGAFAVCIFFFGVYLYTTDKELLQKRLNSKEKEKEQGVYTFAAGASIFSMPVISGLDYRFDWSEVPLAAVITALVVMLAGFALFVITLMYNRFASRTVEIQNEQKVIDTGVYAAVRHPMYTAAITMLFASPVILGSWWALLPMLVFLTGIIFRIRNEEKVLSIGLDGYTDYMKKVRYRLLPFIW